MARSAEVLWQVFPVASWVLSQLSWDAAPRGSGIVCAQGRAKVFKGAVATELGLGTVRFWYRMLSEGLEGRWRN